MLSRRSISIPFLAALPLLPAGLLLSCGGGSEKTTVTIYTSIYEHVLIELDPLLESELPDLRVRWYQRGSEEVAAKVNSELAAGRIRADMIMTSDPFWYEELKRAGHLLAYESPGADAIPAALKDPGEFYAAVRVPVMVLAAHSDLPPAERPQGFKSLTDPKWAGRVTMGNPLQSGSTFTAVAALSKKYGWEYFEALRENDVIAAGGNNSVLQRVSTGEREVGVILLENLLKAKRENPDLPVEIVYPTDGVILVPSPIAIIATTEVPEAARRVYDFMLSEAGQRAIVRGDMYSPMASMPAPAGARPAKEIFDSPLLAWSPEYLAETLARRDEIKERFGRIMFE